MKLEGKPSGELTISNWPLYIDKQTVPDFEKATGVTVKYIEDVNANEEFFAQDAAAARAGRIGRPQHLRRHRLDGEAKCTSSATCRTSTSRRCRTSKRTCVAEPASTRRSTRTATSRVPWQSGMTGIIVHKDLAPDVHSICDLFDPQYKGKVEMLNELRDTVPLVMKCDGVDPEQGDRSTTG